MTSCFHSIISCICGGGHSPTITGYAHRQQSAPSAKSIAITDPFVSCEPEVDLAVIESQEIQDSPPVIKPDFCWTILASTIDSWRRNNAHIESEPFKLWHCPGDFRLRFLPENRIEPTYCSLFLWSSRDVTLKVQLHVNDYTRIMDSAAEVTIKAASDRGFKKFCPSEAKETTIQIFVLQMLGRPGPEWQIPPDRYELFDVVGKGSYGSVRQGWDIANKRKVAVKQMVEVYKTQVNAKRLLREAALLRRLQSPYIVQMFDVLEGSVPQALYVVMEFCDSDLEKLCKNDRVLHLSQVRFLAHSLFSGVAYLHSVGVYHRDLKLANCLVNFSDSSVRLCDFNLARTVPAKEPTSPQPTLRKQLTTKLGTPNYFSPEMVLALDYSEANDVWCAGCILAELFCKVGRGSKGTHEPYFFPRFKGDDMGRLRRIFEVIGTPFNDPRFRQLPQTVQAELCGAIPAFRSMVGCGIEAKVPAEVGHDGVSLLHSILLFFPEDRSSMQDALGHEFFASIQHSSMECGQKANAIDIGFDESEAVSIAKVRRLLMCEVACMRGCMPVRQAIKKSPLFGRFEKKAQIGNTPGASAVAATNTVGQSMRSHVAQTHVEGMPHVPKIFEASACDMDSPCYEIYVCHLPPCNLGMSFGQHLPPNKVVVTELAQQGWAFKSGIRVGDVIQMVNHTNVQALTADTFKKALYELRPLRLTVQKYRSN